ncbi:MAG TPA: S41 family peptidase, partial [Candidatus Angelobacter sp.]|nr:S41 family peptidase [Candidatus Angelobacter sp.]
EKIWHAIQDNYYDPQMNGVDWHEIHQRYRPLVEATESDQDFYPLMERMAGELHDAHTHVLDPLKAANFKKQKILVLGLKLDEFDGKLVVTEVEPGSDAEQKGIVPGTSIETIDGRPLAEKLAESRTRLPDSSSVRATQLLLYARVLDGPGDSSVTLGLKRPDGSRFDTTLARSFNGLSPRLTARLLSSGNAYIKFNAFYPPAASDFTEALHKFHDAPGLIIDLRMNPGGSGAELMAIARNFFSSRTVFAENKLRTRDVRPIYVENKDGHVYDGAVVILVTQHSGSSSELFAAGMQDSGRAQIVGSQTCGCVLGISNPVELKDGAMVTISQVLWFTPSGRKLEGEGVIPDKVVRQTLSEVIAKRDPVLDAGDQLLKEMSSSSPRRMAAH